jgi:hypothetical protein
VSDDQSLIDTTGGTTFEAPNMTTDLSPTFLSNFFKLLKNYLSDFLH